ncbi:MAG: LamG domain-containing protein [Patescibacteria group bacterium]
MGFSRFFRGIRTIISSVFICALFLLLSPSSADAASSLVGYWKFDEGTGTSAADSSGNGNTGTLTNGPTWSSTVPTTAFTNPYSVSFDGTDDYVAIGNSITSLGTTAVTVSSWVRTNSIGANQYILDASTDGGSGNGLSVRIRDNGTIRFWHYNAAANANSVGTLSANVWYHVAVTWDGTTNRIYINGSPDGTNTGDSNSLGSIYQIGHSNVLGGFFNGRLDDVRIYNRALSATEITALAAGTHTTATWTGTTSTDYAVATNWDTGAVPDPYTHVVIANTSNKPILSANESLASLTINASAILDLSSYNW